jgi:8-oxo-dGTP pyrophosphatase MutT (NUDIX family)
MTPAAARPGDGFVDCTCAIGRHWGTAGAAGLALVDAAGERLLMQLRDPRSHGGLAWGIPGGAVIPGESALEAALREAGEEAAVPAEAVRPAWQHVADHGPWAYTTVIAQAPGVIEPVAAQWESRAVAWMPLAQVTALAQADAPGGRDTLADRDVPGGRDAPLHPGFARAWRFIRPRLQARLALIVAAANVMGATPDGGWKDRAGAAARLRDRLAALPTTPLPGRLIGWPEFDGFYPRVELVVEGQAKAVADPASGGIGLIRAPRDGDSAIVERTRVAVDAGEIAVVATADRGLIDRVTQAGGQALGPGALLRLLGERPRGARPPRVG